jgi:hypothetical protein
MSAREHTLGAPKYGVNSLIMSTIQSFTAVYALITIVHEPSAPSPLPEDLQQA